MTCETEHIIFQPILLLLVAAASLVSALENNHGTKQDMTRPYHLSEPGVSVATPLGTSRQASRTAWRKADRPGHMEVHGNHGFADLA
jgi:hypothetical protein